MRGEIFRAAQAAGSLLQGCESEWWCYGGGVMVVVLWWWYHRGGIRDARYPFLFPISYFHTARTGGLVQTPYCGNTLLRRVAKAAHSGAGDGYGYIRIRA